MNEQELERSCKEQIDDLAKFIMRVCPDEIGVGDPVHGESAVEVAIRLIGELKGET